MNITIPTKNFSQLRHLVTDSVPLLIPYLGQFLSDLLFTEEENTDYLQPGMIKWYKCKVHSELIKQVKQYELMPYSFVKVPELRVIIQIFEFS
jgi:hypothetical protein